MSENLPSIALLFPGQGAQEANMGRRLAEHSKDAMDLWKKAESISSLPLREIYWSNDEAAMANTRALQPALCVVNLALWQALEPRMSSVGSIACVAGHSLGEYTALAAAKALTFPEVLELVSLRGRLMDEADPQGVGAMAAILKLGGAQVRELTEQCAEQTGGMLRIANYNTPAQYVISGTKDAVELAASKAKELKGRGLMLKVSGAFHTSMMSEAANEFVPLLRKMQWKKPIMPVYCNVNAKATFEADILRENMFPQMTSSVLWIELMQNQWTDFGGNLRFLEVGPKAVLSKMVAPCLAPLDVSEVKVACLSDYDQELSW